MAETAETTRAETTRERILEAACDLIAADGIDDVRIARVATRARASTALVHHYFSTREELLEQALIHSFEAAGDERFGEEPGEGVTATARLAGAIASACRSRVRRSASGCSGSSCGCEPCAIRRCSRSPRGSTGATGTGWPP